MTSTDGNDRRRTDPAGKAILVLGMHRSGTSAVTRVLNLLGADLSRNLMPGLESDNRPGFWESNDIVPLHEDFLASAGSAWDDAGAFDAGPIGSDAIARFRSDLLDILENDFSGSRLFALKDPRICRFVPIWLEVLEQFGVVPTAVLPIRHPLEVAQSLKARNGFVAEKSLLLWLRHCLEAERATRHIARSIITYDAVLEDWRQVARKVADDLDIEWPRYAAGAEEAIDDFLSPNQRRHSCDLVAFDQHPEIVDWVKRAFESLLSLATKPTDKAAQHQLDSVFSEFQDTYAVFAPVLKGERLRSLEFVAALKERGEEAMWLGRELEMRDAEISRLCQTLTGAEDRIDQLRNSTSWRATRPLRMAKRLLLWGLKLPRRLAKVVYWMITLQLAERLRQRRDMAIINQNRLFDADFYLTAYPELAESRVDPLLHYLETGAAEGRDPNPLFDTSYYHETNPDVAKAGLNPLVHYIVSGAAEGRDPHPLFNSAYLRQNMDMAGL